MNDSGNDYDPSIFGREQDTMLGRVVCSSHHLANQPANQLGHDC